MVRTIELVTMLTVPTMNKEARTTYISQVLFGLALLGGVAFFSGLDGSVIRFALLKAIGKGVNDSIALKQHTQLCTD